MTDIQVVSEAKVILGESPQWDADSNRLYWIDSMKRQILRCAPDGSDLKQWEVPSLLGFLVLRQRGGAVLGLAEGFTFFDFASGERELIGNPQPGIEGVRLNDGKVDRQGRIVAGTLDYVLYERREPPPPSRGGLFRLDPDRSIHQLDRGIGCSNGPCWSPDGSRFYFADSWTGDLWSYDYDVKTGMPSNRAVIDHRLDSTPSGGPIAPDGATVDAEGYLWSVVTNGGEIRRYAPDGTLDRRLEMPLPGLSSVMFGGPDLDILFVTTLGFKRNPEHGPDGGKLFAVRGLGVRGLVEPRFAG